MKSFEKKKKLFDDNKQETRFKIFTLKDDSNL